ncbi:MAG: BrnA antitoxin family protein [Thermomicrobiales bacterium]
MATSSSGSSRSALQPAMSARDIERLLDDYADALAQNADDAIKDEDIDLSDHPAWTEEMFEKAERGTFFRPRTGEAQDELDADVVAWFRQRYPAYQTAMSAVLRAWIEAHEDEDTASEGTDQDHDHDHRKTA